MTKLIALDTETTGVNLFQGDAPFAISTCDSEGVTRLWEWPVNIHSRQPMPPSEELKELVDYIDGSTLIFHNAKFDIRALENLGIRLVFEQVDNIREQPWSTLPYENHDFEAIVHSFEDTLLASHVCDSIEPHGLKDLAEKYLDILDDDQEDLLEAVRAARRQLKSRGEEVSGSVKCDYWLPKAIDETSTHLEKYAVQDAVRTMLLWRMYERVMTEKNCLPQYYTRKALLPITYRMESEGVTIKKVLLSREINRYEHSATAVEAACIKFIRDKKLLDEDFNIRSGQQIQKILYGDPDGPNRRRVKGLNCPITELTNGGSVSTAASTLLDLYHAHIPKRGHARTFISHVLQYRKNKTCAQYLQSYKDIMQKVGKKTLLHPSFNQTGTRTTRWSSSNPNGQNIGSGGKDAFGNEVNDYCLRDVFGPTSGRVWICSDYSQLELRILAVLSQETRLLEAFENDEDIHSLTADLCGISRKAAKGVNYGIIYGAGSSKLEDMTGLSNFDKVFKEAYPGISKFMAATTQQVTKQGFVKTIGGYRLVVPRSKPYIGTNYIVQGSAGDILNRAMIMVDRELKYDDDFPANNKGYLIMCIHDELVFDFEKGRAKKAPAIIKATMEEAGKDLGVITPVDVKRVTQKWSEGKELKL